VTNAPAPRVSWVLLVVLVSALATGAAASILVSASTAPAPANGPAPLVILPVWVFVVASAGVLALVLATMVLWRITSNPSPIMNRTVVSVLAVVLVGIVFIFGARLLGVGGPVATNSTASSGSSSSSGGSNATHGGNVTGAGGYLALFPSVPGWVPIVLLAAVILLTVVVVFPQARAYLAERRERGVARRSGADTVPAGVREALNRASDELGRGGDPRAIILALYSEMLDRLRPMATDLETSTPEEIRAAHLIRLQVRPQAAETLTRLFEEARYSSHPMGAAEGDRARDAVRMTLDDLDRRDFPA
jgi:uncharacterized protein DUF4129